MKLIREIGWPLIVLSFFLIVLGIIFVKEVRGRSYKARSVSHEVMVDLRDDLGWQEIEAIKDNLRFKTYQPVQEQMIDRKKNVYMVKIMCPPEDFVGLLTWLKSRRWVESAT